MKKLIAILLSLSTPSWAAITRIQSPGAGVSSTNCSCTLSATGTGNFLIVSGFNDTAGAMTITDSQSNSYTNIFNTSTNCPNGGQCSAWYKPNIPSGITSVTITGSGSTNCYIICTEYSGIATASPVDQNQTLANGGANTWTSGTITTTNASDLLYGYDANWSGGGTALTGSWGNADSVGFGSFQMTTGDQIVSSIQTNIAFTGTGGTISNGSSIFSFKAASGGAAPTYNSPLFGNEL